MMSDFVDRVRVAVLRDRPAAAFGRPLPAGRPLSCAALLLGASLLGALFAGAASASSVEDISTLERLINAAGVATVVADDCPARYAGYYEKDKSGHHRLVLCRNGVDMADAEAVWEVMAHESTHIMQVCNGGTVIADAYMPRTVRELRTMAPHYAKLIDRSYPEAERRLEAEAFWMELQTPDTVVGLFRQLCANGLAHP